LTNEQLRGEAWQIAKRRGFDSPDGIISTLMTSRLVALGFQVKCETCGRHPWFEMSKIKPVVECPDCLREWTLPLFDPSKIKWAYRGAGPLVSLSASSGAFPVLLAARFLKLLMHLQTTIAFGVELEKDGKKLEFDLGGFFRESAYRPSRTRLLLAECKTYNRFEAHDVKRMEELGSNFPGAVLVFASLRRSLEADEVKQLGAVAKRGRRRVGSEEPANPVMVLTGNELFAMRNMKNQWNGIGGRHAILAEALRDESDILGICNVTQQLYLDLEPMSNASN
jgi:hypothetical protein